MPTYSFYCDKCGFECTCTIKMDAEHICPNCNIVLSRAVVQNIGGFMLKGEGFTNNGRA